jgi:hypothetical protein
LRMTTIYNGFRWDVPHERQCILDIHEALLRHVDPMRVAELYEGRNPSAVRAALAYLFEEGTIEREGSQEGLDGLSDEHRIFVKVFGSRS